MGGLGKPGKPGKPGPEVWRTGPVWIASDRPLARFVGRPVAAFLRVEAAGGLVLVAAVVVALAWANSPWSGSYEAVWTTEAGLRVGTFTLTEELRGWVNDGLMVLFFLVIGLEIKYELVAGELRSFRAAVTPVVAAAGGMVVPALLYAALNAGGPGLAGWGIPLATDTALALGVVALLGRRIPSSARVFLLALAVADDVGAVAVIGGFYTERLSVGWATVALAGVAAILALRSVRVWSFSPYLVSGALVWLATDLSGIHPTIAGVALGLLTPARPLLQEEHARQHLVRTAPDQLDAGSLRKARFLLGESVPVAERLVHALHPWSSFLVLPLFALANAGVDLRAGQLTAVTAGVVLGLVVGKPVGVLAAVALAVRLKVGRLPDGTGWATLTGLALLAGIGFTVSLFITGLAFPAGSALAADAKLGILVASALAALLGGAVLRAASRRDRR